ncbi:hypothetical protein A0H81_02374 [Grifola frondosa]|uniref:Uncharacterized protein n=1 Tax=Grifola frondosa TaxID=5627 RepID=A0A1C7MRA3_GRIFR|nr:hypothetical protein A0H81_02374 [Grifola frondosa]
MHKSPDRYHLSVEHSPAMLHESDRGIQPLHSLYIVSEMVTRRRHSTTGPIFIAAEMTIPVGQDQPLVPIFESSPQTGLQYKTLKSRKYNLAPPCFC